MKKIQKSNEFLRIFNQKISSGKINKLSRQSKFIQRTPRKIDPSTFLMSIFISLIRTEISLTSFAITLGILKEQCISKQAIDKRINPFFIQFLELLLAHCISKVTKTVNNYIVPNFNRILIQDSTCIKLPSWLSSIFPGNRNKTGKEFSIAKIQAVIDIVHEQFVHLSLTPFTVNDQKASSNILSILRKGDLLIRDLGYFVISTLRDISNIGAYFLTRLRSGIVIYDLNNKKRLNLLKILKKRGKIDTYVLIGKDERLIVRLVAMPVDDGIANQRRRKAKKNRDRRLNPNKEHLGLLGWDIFILNADDSMISAENIAKLYGLRWRIEIIFKSWKSNFKIENIPNASAVRVQAHLLAMLIFITLFHTYIFANYYSQIYQQTQKHISILKLTRFIENFALVLYIPIVDDSIIKQQLAYHGVYEKRNDRLNFFQTFNLLS